MYGLKDAPRKFNKYMKKKLELMGWIEIYESVFIYIKNNEVEGIITSHVDDLLLFSNIENEKEILQNINNNFEIEEWIRINDGQLHRYAGISMRYGKDECIIDQCHYSSGIDIGEIESINIDKIKISERDLMVIEDDDINIDKTISKYSYDNYSKIEQIIEDISYSKKNFFKVIKNIKILTISFTYMYSFGLELCIVTMLPIFININY